MDVLARLANSLVRARRKERRGCKVQMGYFKGVENDAPESKVAPLGIHGGAALSLRRDPDFGWRLVTACALKCVRIHMERRFGGRAA